MITNITNIKPNARVT